MADLWDRMVRTLGRHGKLLKDPESLAASFIALFWVVMAGAFGGWLAILILLLITGAVHIPAVETGNHVSLFLATSWLLVVIVMASEITFNSLPPILLAVAGATALAYNELVRINYLRRRNAVIQTEVHVAAGMAVGLASVIGIVAIVVSQMFAAGENRNWLWLPLAAVALMSVGFVLSIVPVRKANEASKERWAPGDRIPPQPLAKDDLEQF